MSLRSDRSGARMDTTTPPMTIGSLCSGISGLDMGVTAATGARTAWFCEREPAPRQVLARHYAGVPVYADVRTTDWDSVEPVDIVTAGYPCQPFSLAGLRKGTNDERHLWPFVADAIRRVGPRCVLLENVRGHLTLGFDRVLGDLADLGFDARWGLFRASDVGAPHQRARLFILARHPDRATGADRSAADADGQRLEEQRGTVAVATQRTCAERRGGRPHMGRYEAAVGRWEAIHGPAPHPLADGRLNPAFVEWMMGFPPGWTAELPRTQALAALGNAVVPHVAALAWTELAA